MAVSYSVPKCPKAGDLVLLNSIQSESLLTGLVGLVLVFVLSRDNIICRLVIVEIPFIGLGSAGLNCSRELSASVKLRERRKGLTDSLEGKLWPRTKGQLLLWSFENNPKQQTNLRCLCVSELLSLYIILPWDSEPKER